MIDLVYFTDLKAIEKQAKKFGLKKVIIAQRFSDKSLNELREKVSKTKFGFKLCHVLEKADLKELRKFRQKTGLIAVKGGSPKMNGFAVQNRVDLLLSPVTSDKLGFDVSTARIAGERKTKIVFALNEFRKLKGFWASQLWKNYLMAAKICRKRKNQCLFFSGAGNEKEMRSIKEMVSFAHLFDFSEKQAEGFLSDAEKNLFDKGIEGYRVVK